VSDESLKDRWIKIMQRDRGQKFLAANSAKHAPGFVAKQIGDLAKDYTPKSGFAKRLPRAALKAADDTALGIPSRLSKFIRGSNERLEKEDPGLHRLAGVAGFAGSWAVPFSAAAKAGRAIKGATSGTRLARLGHAANHPISHLAAVSAAEEAGKRRE